MSDSATQAHDGNGDEIFVGYLPMPNGHRRFLRLILPPLILGFIGAGSLLAWSYRSPGDGVWHANEPETFTGIVATEPYAMLRVADAESPAGVRTIMLVREGKHGAADIVKGLDGATVCVRGTILERDGNRVLEVIEPIEQVAGADVTVTNVPMETLSQVTVRGEIIDPKCFFGAMKPGEGKTHKACATLCIAGGIPPMFLIRGADGSRTYYLLANEAGASVTDAILPYVGDPIEVSGIVERRGDLLILKIQTGTIHRL